MQVSHWASGDPQSPFDLGHLNVAGQAAVCTAYGYGDLRWPFSGRRTLCSHALQTSDPHTFEGPFSLIYSFRGAIVRRMVPRG